MTIIVILVFLLHASCLINAISLPNLNREALQLVESLMEYRPKEKEIWKPTQKYKPTQRAYFAYNLYQEPTNKDFLAVQYSRYNRLYRIGQYKTELPICVVAVGRNMNKNYMLERFIDSVARQNYSNYLVFYADDASTDDSVEAFNSHVKTLDEGTKIKFKAIKKEKQQYALKNRHKTIKSYCSKYSIVVDVDIDDALIGNQVFKLVNAKYQSQNIWLLYSTHIKFDDDKKEPVLGICDPISPEELENNSYRVSESWVTSELRTFKKELYQKIDEKDYLDENGQFYKWASDRFVLYPMIQMASKGHISYLPEPLYFYDLSGLSYRDYTFIIPDKMIAKMQTPYLPLSSLSDKAERRKDYVVPRNIRQQYENSMKKAEKSRNKMRLN